MGGSDVKSYERRNIYCQVIAESLRGNMQDFVNSTKFGLEDVGRGRAKLRNIEEGGEALGVILTCRKGRRQGCNMDFSSSLLLFGHR